MDRANPTEQPGGKATCPQGNSTATGVVLRESYDSYPLLPQGTCRCLCVWRGEHKGNSSQSCFPHQRKHLTKGCDQSPLPEMGTMVWHDHTILAKSLTVSQQRNLQLYDPAFQYQYFAQLWLRVWCNKRVLSFFFFFSPQEISVVQEDLQDSECFYELRSTLLFQGPIRHIRHSHVCVCFPSWEIKRRLFHQKKYLFPLVCFSSIGHN